jgi:hypothetical protein
MKELWNFDRKIKGFRQSDPNFPQKCKTALVRTSVSGFAQGRAPAGRKIHKTSPTGPISF